jgi:tetratricopeptide (TPR) repeat protein
VDHQTKVALKQDNFITTTGSGLEWASENRRSVIVTTSLLLAAILLVVIGFVVYNKRSEAASEAFGAAMQAYQTPIAVPDQPIAAGTKTFPSEAERAKAANALFLAAANKYGLTADGRNARYFAGLTSMEAGQNQSAEDSLKQVASGWDKSLAALAKLALAQLYRQTGRDPQAIDLYNQLTAHPAVTVPAGLAQLQLAELYTSENKPDMAKKIYAQLKDKDPKSAAGSIASQKLNPAPAGGGPR